MTFTREEILTVSGAANRLCLPVWRVQQITRILPLPLPYAGMASRKTALYTEDIMRILKYFQTLYTQGLRIEVIRARLESKGYLPYVGQVI